jgi:hypothetical protein
MLDGHGQREVNGQRAPADGRQSASTIPITISQIDQTM